MKAENVNPQSRVPTHQVLVISKKTTADGKILLVKQKEACHCSDEKLKQYRKENRLLIVDMHNQKIIVQQGECADFFKGRGVDRIEFKPHVGGAQSREAIDINDIHELSEEEFNELMAASLKEATEQLEKGKEVLNGLMHKCGCKPTPNLRDIIRQYLKQNPEKSISEIITRMLSIWRDAAKEDREQEKISEEKRQRIVEDIIRRRLLDTVVKDEIKATEISKSFNADNLGHPII